jgi:hypothetical protein
VAQCCVVLLPLGLCCVTIFVAYIVSTSARLLQATNCIDALARPLKCVIRQSRLPMLCVLSQMLCCNYLTAEGVMLPYILRA